MNDAQKKERARHFISIARAYAEAVPMPGLFGCHPFTTSCSTYMNGKITIVDEKNKKEFFDYYIKQMESETEIHSLFYHIQKPYRIPILIAIKGDLSKEELGFCLRNIWIETEYPHSNRISDLTHLFKEAQGHLMEESEVRTLSELPEEIIVYRGLQGPKAKKRGLSWTISKSKAEWFAKRFGGGGQIFQATINKRDVFAFFDTRNEDEIVVNPHKLKGVIPIGENQNL